MLRSAVMILLLAAMAAAAEPAARLIPFDLKDQHGVRHTQERFRDRPLLLLWGDRKGSDFMALWARALDDSTGGDSAFPQRLDVAHGRGAPFFVKGRIRKRFREDFTGPVLLDWKGIFAESYACPDDSCTILLFDAGGSLEGRWTVGEPVPGQLRDILREARLLGRPAR